MQPPGLLVPALVHVRTSQSIPMLCHTRVEAGQTDAQSNCIALDSRLGCDCPSLASL